MQREFMVTSEMVTKARQQDKYDPFLLNILDELVKAHLPAVDSVRRDIQELLMRFFSPYQRGVSGGVLALAGVLFTDTRESWIWRLCGWSRLASHYDESCLLRKALLIHSVQIALDKGLPILPDVLIWYLDYTGKQIEAEPLTFSLSDEQLFSLLTSDNAKYDGISECVQRGDYEAAKRGYIQLAALSERIPLEHAAAIADYLDGKADDIMRDVFPFPHHMDLDLKLAQPIDWTHVMMDDMETNVCLNNHDALAILARAYQKTGDMRYAQKLSQLWASWYEANPPAATLRKVGPWRTLEAGVRSWQNWPVVLSIIDSCQIARDKVAFDLVRRYLEQGLYLMANQASGFHNWFQVESCGLATTGALFPEFSVADYFYQIGVERLRRVNKECFLADGMQYECSPTIHYFPFSGLVTFLQVARKMSREVPDELIESFGQIADVFVNASQPDGVLPPIQDTPPRIRSAAQGAKLALGVMDKPEWRYIASSGRQGSAPTATSWAFEDSGYYIMRENWTPNSPYLLFDAGYFGHNHQHEDKLSFILHAHGRTLIGDPGIYRFRKDGFEKYYRGTRAHNCITIDGKEQCRYQLGGSPQFPDPDAQWYANGIVTFVAGAYRDGFTAIGTHSRDQWPLEHEHTLCHERFIFHPAHSYYLLRDRLTGGVGGNRTIRQWFHPAPRITQPCKSGVHPIGLSIGKLGFHTTEKDLANVVVMSLQKVDDIEHHCGVIEPTVQGWWALYGNQPSHDISFCYRRELPCSLFTLLVPVASAEKPSVHYNVARLTGDRGLQLTIDTKFGQDLLLVSDDAPTELCGDELSGYGQLLWLRRDEEGRVLNVSCINGQLISYHGNELWSSNVVTNYCSP